MKGFKFIATVVMSVVVVSLLVFGTYGMLRNNTGVQNKTEFITGDDNVFVRINGTYDGPALTTAGANKNYFYELNRDSVEAYGDPASVPAWILGDTNFTVSNLTITLTFSFENLNDVNDMLIDISDIAFSTEQKFTTSYAIANNQSELNEAQLTPAQSETQVAKLDTINVESLQTKYVKLVYTIRDFSEDFVFENNIKVVFTTVVEE